MLMALPSFFFPLTPLLQSFVLVLQVALSSFFFPLTPRLIGQAAGRVERVSSFIETEPWGFSSEHRFINCCIRIATPLTPHQLLKATQAIEIQLGRTAKSVDGQYHDRPIDIDILTYDDLHIDAPDLHIPHPHMHERDFVMRPLSEIM